MQVLEGAKIVDRTGAVGKLRSVYVRDPDGNLIEYAISTQFNRRFVLITIQGFKLLVIVFNAFALLTCNEGMNLSFDEYISPWVMLNSYKYQSEW